MTKYLIICAALVSGCCTTDARIGEPYCEERILVTEVIWNDLGEMRNTMEHNQRVDSDCIELLQNRIRLHDQARP